MIHHVQNFNRIKIFWIKFFATVGFIGYCPVASGTAGTLVGLGMYVLVGRYFLLHLALTLVLLFFGVWLSSRAEQIFKEHDSHLIVVDELVGYLVTMLGIFDYSWHVLAIGFLLNRVFDIFKPFPLRKLEELPAGWGVMMDDVGAGILSNIVLRIILAVF